MHINVPLIQKPPMRKPRTISLAKLYHPPFPAFSNARSSNEVPELFVAGDQLTQVFELIRFQAVPAKETYNAALPLDHIQINVYKVWDSVENHGEKN